MRIATWTIDRHAPETTAAKAVLKRIAGASPDIVCLNEAHEGSLASLAADVGGEVLFDRGADWGGETPTSRKLALWSKTPWRDRLDMDGPCSLGGAISAVTARPTLDRCGWLGSAPPPLSPRPAGVCHAPHWSLHIAYLEALGARLKALDRHHPTLIIGALNQYVPLTRGAWVAHHALMDALQGFGLVTRGDVPPTGEQTIAHVAVSKHLRASRVCGLNRFDAEDKSLTEQFGVLLDLESGGVRVFD